jgi:hypothetical protein
MGLTVAVCHFPPATSKWNKKEEGIVVLGVFWLAKRIHSVAHLNSFAHPCSTARR